MKSLFPNTFEIGEPTNETVINLGGGRHLPCRVPGRDYSGADPEIQFPKDYHCKAGLGSPLTGAYHQDVGHFEPWRVRVANCRTDLTYPFNHLEKPDPLLCRMMGGTTAQPNASAMLARDFTPLKWADQQVLIAGVWVLPKVELNDYLYFNFELRGGLDFFPVQEGSLVLGCAIKTLSVGRAQTSIRWWNDGVDGESHDTVQRELVPFTLLMNQYYEIRLVIAPTSVENEWNFKVKLRPQYIPTGTKRSDLVYRFTPVRLANNITSITAVALGDEQEHLPGGGTVYVSQVSAQVTETAKEREKWLKILSPTSLA